MPFSIIPFLLLVIPLLEIGAFIVVGGQIGVLPTLGLVLVTAIAGSILLRVQGFGVINRIRQTVDAGRVPGRELVHGVMILVAGVLLLTPGFITDTLGFLLFIPAVRDIGWTLLRDRIVVTDPRNPQWQRHTGPHERPGTRTIDLDADEYSDPPNQGSPWRKSGKD